jgi:hypothetical protein
MRQLVWLIAVALVAMGLATATATADPAQPGPSTTDTDDDLVKALIDVIQNGQLPAAPVPPSR